MGKPKSSLCWLCDNALGGCSWSKSFVPVEGWDAFKRDIVDTHTGHVEESWFVEGCPEFVPYPPRKEQTTLVSGQARFRHEIAEAKIFDLPAYMESTTGSAAVRYAVIRFWMSPDKCWDVSCLFKLPGDSRQLMYNATRDLADCNKIHVVTTSSHLYLIK